MLAKQIADYKGDIQAPACVIARPFVSSLALLSRDGIFMSLHSPFL